MFDRIWPRVRLRAERSDVEPVSAPPGLLRLVRRSCQKKEHNLATMRRGYPAFFVQGGSAAGRWETRKDRTRLALGPWAGSPSPGPSPHKRPGAGGGSRAGQRVPGRRSDRGGD